MSSKRRRWTRERIAELCAEHPLPRAAEEIGITAQTLRSWMADDPEIEKLAKVIAKARFDQSCGRLPLLAAKALHVLEVCLSSEDDRVRIRAAERIAALLDFTPEQAAETSEQELERKLATLLAEPAWSNNVKELATVAPPEPPPPPKPPMLRFVGTGQAYRRLTDEDDFDA